MSRYFVALAAGLFLLFGGSLSADTIKLEGGGTVRGQILDDKSNDEVLVIKVRGTGAETRIDRKKIESIVREKPPTEEYEAIKGQYDDTADDQFKLAMWCEEHRLTPQRKTHLERVIELDPDHAKAREKLGYIRRDGKWTTRDEIEESKGRVKYNGRYVTPQEKEILEQKKREDESIKEWYAKVRMWKTWLAGRDAGKARQGEERLRAIDDPKALDAIVGSFGKEKDEQFRVLMCEMVGNLEGEPATMELVKRSIIDGSSKVRWAAIDRLADRQDPAAVKSLMKALESDHNGVLRRAADALGAIGDPTAVPALITALSTKHKEVVTKQQQTASFGGNSTPVILDYEPVVANGVVVYQPVIGVRQSGGMSLGGTKQEIITVEVENQEVLDALKAITKEDFGYNKTSWRGWFANQARREELKNRRKLEGK